MSYRIALNVRHGQDTSQVLGDAGLAAAGRPSDEPDVVVVVLAGRRSSSHCRVEVGHRRTRDLRTHAVGDEVCFRRLLSRNGQGRVV